MFAASAKIFTPVFKHFQFERVAKADPLVDIKNDEFLTHFEQIVNRGSDIVFTIDCNIPVNQKPCGMLEICCAAKPESADNKRVQIRLGTDCFLFYHPVYDTCVVPGNTISKSFRIFNGEYPSPVLSR